MAVVIASKGMTMLAADISCPKCHKSVSVPFGEIGPGKSKPCPNCGTIIRFAGADVGKVQQVIDQLGAQGSGASVKVTVKARQKRPWWRFWAG